MNARERRHVGWASAVGVHAGRLLTRWRRTPASVFSTVVTPMIMVIIMKVMFSGMVEQFGGDAMNMTSICVMVGVAQAFTTALVGAGSIVQERHEGLPARLATVPGPRFSGIAGRILAGAVTSFVSMVSAVVMGLVLGADFRTVGGLLGTAALLAVVSVATGSVGVMLGFLVETPQGAMSFVPLLMVAMFFNTAMMPRNLYAAALRPVVDLSPMTAVIELVKSLVDGRVRAGEVVSFTAWFGALIALALVVLARRSGRIAR